MSGQFYLSADSTETNELIWFDEKQGVVFELAGYLEKPVMLNIAESIYLDKLNKDK
jgi:hypothetical protein